MTEDTTSPEQRDFTPEKRPEGQKLGTAVSLSPEEIRELVKGDWADDWRAIKEKLAPEQVPKDEEGRILRTNAVVVAAFPKASKLTQKITVDVLRRQMDEAEIEATNTNVSLFPLARNLVPLVEKLEAKPLEPTISEANKAKLQQLYLLDKAAREAGIEQGIAGALSELQKTQRALGAAQEASNKRIAETLKTTHEAETLRKKVDELTSELQKRDKTSEAMLKQVNEMSRENGRLVRKLQEARKKTRSLQATVVSKDELIQKQEQEIQSLKAKPERPLIPVTPPPPEKKPFAVAAENLSSNLKAIKAIDLLVHQGNLMANEKAKQADTRALLNEALSKYPDSESLRSALQKLIETRITVSKKGLTPEEFRQAKKLKRQEYLNSVASLLTDLEEVYGRKVEELDVGRIEKEGKIKVLSGAHKDIGRARDNMEDDFGLVEPKESEILEQRGRLYVVTDGVGGYLAGEVASRLAVEIICNDYYEEEGAIAEALSKAIQKANRRIHREAQEATKKKMGTTVVAAVVRGNELHIAHAGDSRAYLLRNGKIHQLTEDHSWVQTQVKAGALTPVEARRHPQRNVITRCLGNKPKLKVDSNKHSIEKGDSIILCTDGLSEMVDDERIKELVLDTPNPQSAAQRLIEEANLNGGRDNIAAVVIKVEQIG